MMDFIDGLANACAFAITMYQSGFYFENFGKGSAMENYLHSIFKI